LEQGRETVLKINPEEWNNVPVIVYESIFKIVSELDKNFRRQALKFEEIGRSFKDQSNLVTIIE
jgi:hypothetical protein